MHEFELIKKHFKKLTKDNPSALKLNDDVFFDRSKKIVVSIDTYVQGIHFINFNKPDLVIKKIIRSSISDLICKGVKPKYYFISGSGNDKSFSQLNLHKISKSLKQEQDKYNIFLCGGDTVYSNKLNFSITSIGFSEKIIKRNNARLNDDIYVTGNLGDSFVGLKVLKKQIKLNNKLKNYFVKKYYEPDLQFKLINWLTSFANTSIDISDGLIADLEKLINNQRLSYKLNFEKIPVSKHLKNLIVKKKLNKSSFISNGDDYQILFTAKPDMSRIINNIAKSLSVKISKIGKICSNHQKSQIIDENGNKIAFKTKGYFHKF